MVVGERTITDIKEKAEALRTTILTRFSAEDDLPLDIENYLQHRPATENTLPWDIYLLSKETERSVIRVTSISPGPDRITVRLLRIYWTYIKETI